MQIRRRNPNPKIRSGEVAYQSNIPDTEPNNILEEIIWYKEVEVEAMRDRLPLIQLRQQVQDVDPALDFLGALRNGKTNPALIAEVKKASPSKGVIKADFNPVAIAKAYVEGGASCLSVLTDSKFFQGSFDNLSLIRSAVKLPLLCKEFIIYPYQIYYARAKGADAILLIAAVLENKDLNYFVKIIKALGMTPLVEVHTQAELDRVLEVAGVELIGINNRNLEDFSVDLRTTQDLIASSKEALEQQDITIVSESGIHTFADLDTVRQAGAKAVLIGESLVKQDDLPKAIADLFKI